MERMDDYIQLDNTRVKRRFPFKIKLTRDLLLKLLLRKLQQASALKLGRIYDTVKAEYYKNMQNFYNLNAFGYGVQGNQTGHDYTTNKGLLAIQSNFDYAKNNALNLIELIAGAGLSAAASSSISKGSLLYSKLTKGKFLTPSKRGSLGTMKQYTKDGTIGSGAEAVVINNTPITVGKITTIPLKEMLARNAIPNTVESKYIGFVKDGGVKLPTYILRKVKTLTEHTFPKYISRLDKSMQKAGFRRVTDPNVLYRAYTNGTVVVDDVSPGNVGLDWLRRPRMIDFNLQTVPEWIALGFTLKKGGKLLKYLSGGYIILPDNTRVNPIIVRLESPNFTRLNLSILGRAMLDKTKKENPDFYNKKVRLEAHKAKPNSEIVRYEDAKGKTRTSSKVIGMSGADPIASLYVDGVALNPIFKLAGRAAQWGLAKAGNNWARAKILSKELDSRNPSIIIPPGLSKVLMRAHTTFPYEVSYNLHKNSINFNTARSIQNASKRLQDFYNSSEYREHLAKASAYDKIFSNMYVPNTLAENLQKGIIITPDKNREWLGVTHFNRSAKRPIISLKLNMSLNELDPTAYHEVAHASLKGHNGSSQIWALHIEPYLKDKILLRDTLELIKNFGLKKDDFKLLLDISNHNNYVSDVNEIRSRTLSLMDLAKKNNLNFSDFIDKYSYSKYPELFYGTLEAPGELNDLLRIMTPQEIKNFGKIVIGSTPIMLKTNEQRYNK